jgi:RimJ/RimL family protein N-acetyltransferase
MDLPLRWEIAWRAGDEALRAFEPTDSEVAAAAPELAVQYNDAHNRRMMGHTEALSADEVAGHYTALRGRGGRPFLLERAGALAGDADLRNLDGRGGGELAILVGARQAQGQGLGTRYAVMLHAFAFRILDLERVFVSIIPENGASRRLFEKLGYRTDDSPAARAHLDDASDVTMSVERSAFEAVWSPALAEIALTRRPQR